MDASAHRVVEEWMGAPVETLADLLRPGLRAVVVGINPSQVSVDAGHYYQGVLGRRFFARLRRAGVLGPGPDTIADDLLFRDGIGFTDIVKRPTRRAAALATEEFLHGLPLLTAKLTEHRPDLVLFTYRQAAEFVVGRHARPGMLPGAGPDGIDCFLMPGPYERAPLVAEALRHLQACLEA